MEGLTVDRVAVLIERRALTGLAGVGVLRRGRGAGREEHREAQAAQGSRHGARAEDASSRRERVGVQLLIVFHHRGSLCWQELRPPRLGDLRTPRARPQTHVIARTGER